MAPHVMQPNLLCVFPDQKQCAVLRYTARETGKRARGWLKQRICEKCRCQNEIKFSESYPRTVTTSQSALCPSAILSLR